MVNSESKNRGGAGQLQDLRAQVAELKQALIREQEEAQENLRASEELYHAVFNIGSDALLIQKINPDASPGPYLDVNQVACDKLGYSRDELLQMSTLDFASPELIERLPAIGRQVAKEGHAEFEADYLTKNGKRLPVEVWLKFLVVQGVALVVSNGRDITQRKKNEFALIKTKEKAEAANQAKSAFLGNMGHELRTPLHGLQGMTDFLLDTELSPQQRRYGDTIKTSAQTLLVLINDLLDLTKIEAGQLVLQAVPFDPNQVMAQMLTLFGARAREKNLILHSHTDPTIPDAVVGDAARITQVLTNLVSNAIKFTEHGQITISLFCPEQTDSHSQIKFAVEDSGIGIAPEKQSQIFEKFTQVDPSSHRRFQGTGLGLAISKQLVKSMGSSLELKSTAQKGSTFWFTLQLPKPKP